MNTALIANPVRSRQIMEVGGSMYFLREPALTGQPILSVFRRVDGVSQEILRASSYSYVAERVIIYQENASCAMAGGWAGDEG